MCNHNGLKICFRINTYLTYFYKSCSKNVSLVAILSELFSGYSPKWLQVCMKVAFILFHFNRNWNLSTIVCATVQYEIQWRSIRLSRDVLYHQTHGRTHWQIWQRYSRTHIATTNHFELTECMHVCLYVYNKYGISNDPMDLIS